MKMQPQEGTAPLHVIFASTALLVPGATKEERCPARVPRTLKGNENHLSQTELMGFIHRSSSTSGFAFL